MLLAKFCGVIVTVVMASCSTGLPVQRDNQQSQEGVPAPPHSIVCVIHGDGDYLYHDTSGNEFAADEEALAAIQRVALRNPDAEVFVFHHKPLRRLLLLFPLDDGEFSCYRNGRLIASESYRRNQEQSRLAAEAEFYRRFRAPGAGEQVRLFLYFGHEIPEWGGTGYDASYPDRPFTVHGLAHGLNAFTVGSGRFDLMVLSTCYGGTPYTIAALGPLARFVIASPGNLHLSYFDVRAFEHLGSGLQKRDVSALARQFARRAFGRLTDDIHTAVSVVVFDVDRVQPFLQSVHARYEQTMTALHGETDAPATVAEHCDCGDLPAYKLPIMHEGVEVLYRPARFGRLKQKQTHSGWECWREGGAQAAQ